MKIINCIVHWNFKSFMIVIHVHLAKLKHIVNKNKKYMILPSRDYFRFLSYQKFFFICRMLKYLRLISTFHFGCFCTGTCICHKLAFIEKIEGGGKINGTNLSWEPTAGQMVSPILSVLNFNKKLCEVDLILKWGT